MNAPLHRISRRDVLAGAAGLAGWTGLAGLGGGVFLPAGCLDRMEGDDELLPADANGLRLLRGFSSRVLAVSGEKVSATGYVWHHAPDGGAVFAAPDEGWIYVSNSELSRGAGGASAMRFDAEGSIVGAYSILRGTDQNCAGGATPWATWLSCEEVRSGEVYECDPFAPGSQGIVRPALGAFKHEAVAVDADRRMLYMTEDESDGLLYRFIPDDYPRLDSGRLEAAQILDDLEGGRNGRRERRGVVWHPIADATGTKTPTRRQAPRATRFDGGEGIAYHEGLVYFTTKGDDRVWKLDVRTQEIEVFYDRATSPTPHLSGVDNLLIRPSGVVYVAEDPGNLEVVALTQDGGVRPILRLMGHFGSEITGLATSPDGSRLYFSSQRFPGTTYEVRGPF